MRTCQNSSACWAQTFGWVHPILRTRTDSFRSFLTPHWKSYHPSQLSGKETFFCAQDCSNQSNIQRIYSIWMKCWKCLFRSEDWQDVRSPYDIAPQHQTNLHYPRRLYSKNLNQFSQMVLVFRRHIPPSCHDGSRCACYYLNGCIKKWINNKIYNCILSLNISFLFFP